LINQQINPIKAVDTIVDRIKREKPIVFSRGTWKKEKKKIRVASRVPRPEMEIGKRVINPAMVTVIAR